MDGFVEDFDIEPVCKSLRKSDIAYTINSMVDQMKVFHERLEVFESELMALKNNRVNEEKTKC